MTGGLSRLGLPHSGSFDRLVRLLQLAHYPRRPTTADLLREATEFMITFDRLRKGLRREELTEFDGLAPVTPRLLTPAQAMRYLGGADPADYARCHGTRAGPRYDRAEIDAALDRLAGLARSSAADDPEAALDSWLERAGGAA